MSPVCTAGTSARTVINRVGMCLYQRMVTTVNMIYIYIYMIWSIDGTYDILYHYHNYYVYHNNYNN